MQHALFFEKQDAALCAVHAVNNLLQEPIYTAVDFAGFAQALDAQEARALNMARLAESSNVDDDGNFSVAVIEKALEHWSLALENRDAARAVTSDPLHQTAFICNLAEHWFTIRRVGTEWWNLNSLNSEPEWISPTFLGAMLETLRQQGYTVFNVVGTLPPCAAETIPYDRAAHVADRRPAPAQAARTQAQEDAELAAAIAASLGDDVPPTYANPVAAEPTAVDDDDDDDDDDAELRAALELSLQEQ